MNAVTRYNCEFCNKDFKTPTRHICKRDPKFKNCHSCKFCKGWEDEDREGGINVGIGTIDTSQLYPICEKDCGELGARDIYQNNYDLNCSEYEVKR